MAIPCFENTNCIRLSATADGKLQADPILDPNGGIECGEDGLKINWAPDVEVFRLITNGGWSDLNGANGLMAPLKMSGGSGVWTVMDSHGANTGLLFYNPDLPSAVWGGSGTWGKPVGWADGNEVDVHGHRRSAIVNPYDHPALLIAHIRFEIGATVTDDAGGIVGTDDTWYPYHANIRARVREWGAGSGYGFVSATNYALSGQSPHNNAHNIRDWRDTQLLTVLPANASMWMVAEAVLVAPTGATSDYPYNLDFTTPPESSPTFADRGFRATMEYAVLPYDASMGTYSGDSGDPGGGA